MTVPDTRTDTEISGEISGQISVGTGADPGYAAGLRNLTDEIGPVELPVEGELPAWLSGDLIRNGPALFDVGDRSFRHWFDGQAMLHRFSFGDGGVTYRNRFLDTPGLRSARAGRIDYSEFATDPCGGMFRRLFSRFRSQGQSQNAGVNVVASDEGPLAITETPLAVRFDPQTLATVGVQDVAESVPGQLTTAHPHQVPGSPDLVNYVLRFGPRSHYQVYRQKGGSRERQVIASVPADRPGYMHSFAVTERHVVLAVFPFVVDPRALLLRRRPFIENYRWQPERGTRFVVIGLEDGAVREIRSEQAIFAFHHINAYDEGDDVVIDLCAYPDAGIVRALLLEQLRAGRPVPVAVPTRVRLHLGAGTATTAALSTEPLELPRISYAKHNGRPYRYAYGVGAHGGSGADFVNQLTKVDVTTGQTEIWYEPGSYPGEPVFVPAPGAETEDDGVVLSVVLGPSGSSSMLVLDAATWQVRARAEVPHAVPLGFHGQFTRRPAG